MAAKAYRHWLTMEESKWPTISYPEISYLDIIYAAPKNKGKLNPAMYLILI